MKPPVWKRSSYRIAATTALILALTGLLLGGGVLAIARAHMARSLDASIMALCDPITALAKSGDTAAVHAAVRKAAAIQDDHLGVALFDARGRQVLGDLDITRPPPGWSDIILYDPIEGRDLARLHATDMPSGERMVVIGNRRPLEIADQAIRWAALAAATVILLLSVALAVLLGRTLDARLGPITRTADAVIAGEPGQRVPLSGRGDEFDRVARSLNAMLDRVSQLMANLRGIAGDIAHDLRTPLARLRTRLEVAGDDPAMSREAIIDTSIAAIDQLLALFGAVLRIAEIEEGAEAASRAPVDLAELAGEIAEAMQPVFEEAGLTLRLDCPPGVVALADRQQMASALINLLENALCHTAPGTQVSVSAAIHGPHALLEVADTGPGVPDAELGRIFDRFVRLDTARGTPGHGLGLSLVQAIALANSGTVKAGNGPSGFFVRLALPLANAS